MNSAPAIATDLVLSPFGATANELIEAAKCVEDSGFDGIWTLDHFSGAVAEKNWSHEPFTILGSIAATTQRIKVGTLVANMMNRHPILLASAFSSLQGVSGGRAVLGLGTGAPPGTLFASEQEMINRDLHHDQERRRRLVETIQMLRTIWSGQTHFEGEFASFMNLEAIIEPNSALPIVVGANGLAMVQLAVEHADGVNIRLGPSIERLVEEAVVSAPNKEFEISVHESFDVNHPYGGDVDKWVQLGVHRRACMLAAPFDLQKISRIGTRLRDDG